MRRTMTTEAPLDGTDVLHQQWQHQDEGALLVSTLSFLDIQSLLQMESVSTFWRGCCKRAIHAKLEQNVTGKAVPFETKEGLQAAVNEYFKKNFSCNIENVPAVRILCTTVVF